MFIDGYLALATAFPTPGTITEYTGPNYHRQPISFGVPKSGITRNAVPFSFGFGLGTIAGRAIFSSPTGSELLLALPFATPYAYGSQPDVWDAGAVGLLFSDLLNFDPTGAASSFLYAAGAVLGTCWNDPRDFIGYTPALSPAGVTLPAPARKFATGAMVAGVPLSMKRGVLSSQAIA